jgi:hypothetical protein
MYIQGLQLFFVRAPEEDVVSLAKTSDPDGLFYWFTRIFSTGGVDQVTRAAERLHVLMERGCVPRQDAIKLLKDFREHKAWPTIKEHLSNDVIAAVEAGTNF